MKRRRTILAHFGHYYHNKAVKLAIGNIVRLVQQGRKEEAQKAFLSYQKMVNEILSPFRVIDEISETNSSELPREVKDALEVIVEKFDAFKSQFVFICEEFPQSLETCPKTFLIALESLGLEYDQITESDELEKFTELY